MGDAKRVVIGSEIDDTKRVELDRAGSKVAVPVTIYDAGGNQVSIASGIVSGSYDRIVLGYDASNNLISAVYSLSGVTIATLTLTYDSGGNLTKVQKS